MTTPWPLQRRQGVGRVPRFAPVTEHSLHSSSRDTVTVLLMPWAASARVSSTSTL